MSRKHGFAGVALALALDGSAEAFTAFPTVQSVRASCLSTSSLAMATDPVQSSGGLSVGRGEFLASAAASIGLALVATPGVAGATVNFETERYGDKELKIATVNKLRQQIRNALLKDPKLAPDMIKLAIADALGFDVATQSGGPDGSVMLEMDRGVAKGLKPALEAAIGIKKDMQRTNEMTLADIVSMGGAEAIHAVGGPLITVQLGRYDEKKAANPSPDIAGYNFEAPTAAGVKAAFKRAGLGTREMVLLLGAIGSVADVTTSVDNDSEDGEEDDLEDLSWQKGIPGTFGKESDKFGKALASGFGPGFLQRVAASNSGVGTGVIGAALMEDDEVKSFVRKYAGNSKAFAQDLSEAYTKMTLLGERYETRNAM